MKWVRKYDSEIRFEFILLTKCT